MDEKKQLRQKTIYFEKYVKVDCPYCNNQITLNDCGIPPTIFCDNCIKTFRVKSYTLKERRQR